MARQWTPQERRERHRELIDLYDHRKMPIAEIASALGLRPATAPSGDLAEFCGIMLGDGHIGSGQLWVSVNAQTDLPYVPYVQDLFEKLFSFRPRLRGYRQDGSIYRLKWFDAVQMSFSNRSMQLLDGTRQALLDLGYHPSRVSDLSVYLTRRGDIEKYIQEIGFGNAKHQFRAKAFGIMPAVPHTW